MTKERLVDSGDENFWYIEGEVDLDRWQGNTAGGNHRDRIVIAH